MVDPYCLQYIYNHIQFTATQPTAKLHRPSFESRCFFYVLGIDAIILLSRSKIHAVIVFEQSAGWGMSRDRPGRSFGARALKWNAG